MAKKAKSKWTEGWLARDKKRDGGYIAFFTGAPPTYHGYCLWATGGAKGCHVRQCWSPAQFKKVYGLKKAPPYGGKQFVDMEL